MSNSDYYNDKLQERSVLSSEIVSDISSPLTRRKTSQFGQRPPSSPEEEADKIYREIGGCGLFQVMAYLAICFGMSSPSWFVY